MPQSSSIFTLFAAVTGKLLGYSVSMSIAIGLTALYGYPGTMG